MLLLKIKEFRKLLCVRKSDYPFVSRDTERPNIGPPFICPARNEWDEIDITREKEDESVKCVLRTLPCGYREANVPCMKPGSNELIKVPDLTLGMEKEKRFLKVYRTSQKKGEGKNMTNIIVSLAEKGRLTV